MRPLVPNYHRKADRLTTRRLGYNWHFVSGLRHLAQRLGLGVQRATRFSTSGQTDFNIPLSFIPR
jgi:hypothetical protein